MNTSTELMQLYILLSYEKLQRSTISQHHRPIEASLRNRLLVWRFLKKIESEPVPTSNYEPDLSANDHNETDAHDLANSDSWILDLHANCDNSMDIDSDLFSTVDNSTSNDNSYDHSLPTCETMNLDQSSDVNVLLTRAIGAERRQKVSPDNLLCHETSNTNLQYLSEMNTFDETEQFFQDLCAELTSTTATLVSSSTANALNFSTSPEQTLIH